MMTNAIYIIPLLTNICIFGKSEDNFKGEHIRISWAYQMILLQGVSLLTEAFWCLMAS